MNKFQRYTTTNNEVEEENDDEDVQEYIIDDF
jgi:hypothetical protein